MHLAEAIKTVVPRMSSNSALRVAGRVIDIMAATGDGLALEELVDALAGVPGYLDVATLINLLKFPMCVGPPRAALLRALEIAHRQGVRGRCLAPRRAGERTGAYPRCTGHTAHAQVLKRCFRLNSPAPEAQRQRRDRSAHASPDSRGRHVCNHPWLPGRRLKPGA